MTLRQSWPGVSGKAQVLDIRNDLASAVVRQGVMPMADMTTPIMSKSGSLRPTVREFHAAIKRPNRSDGVQLIYNDGPTGTFPTFGSAPATGTRMDLLWVKAFDTLYDDRANVEFGITPGISTTGTAVPDRASMPEGALELGTLLIPAGATTLNSSGVVWRDTYQIGALRAAPVFFRSTDDMTDADAGLHPVGVHGSVVNRIDDYVVRLKIGSTNVKEWTPVNGVAKFTTSSANGNDNTSYPQGNITKSTDNFVYNDGFATIGTDRINLEPGVYSITHHVSMTRSSTGRTFSDLRANGSSSALDRVTIPSGEDTATAGASLYLAVSGYIAATYTKVTGGANATVVMTITIIKIA